MKNFLNILKKSKFIKLINSIFLYIIQRKITKFQIIFTSYFFIFSIFLFFSIPSVYDFKKFERRIIEKTDAEFKLKLSNITNINYRFIPSPHIVLESTDVKLKDNSVKISTIKNLKIFISVIDFYKNKSFDFKEIKINKANIYFDKDNLNLFREHLNKKINKPVTIKNSNIFYKDGNKDIVSISPVKKLKYLINFTTKEKKLDINGTIFDSKYDFLWHKNYNEPDKREIILNLNNPNIKIENVINNRNNKDFEGTLKLRFISNDFDFKYKKLNDIITFKSSSTNDKFKFNGTINILPFYFDVNAKIKSLDLNYLIDYILNSFNKSDNFIHENLNGQINFEFNKMKNTFFQTGNVKIGLKEGKIFIDETSFKIKKIGNIKFSEGFYKIYNNNLYYVASASLDIKNQKEFYRLFLIPTDNRINLSKINFVIEKNLDENEYYISNFKVNHSNKKKINIEDSEKIEFSNIQQLRIILRNYFSELNQG